MQGADAQRLFERIAANIEAVMRGQHAQVRKLLAAFAAGGHVLDRKSTRLNSSH